MNISRKQLLLGLALCVALWLSWQTNQSADATAYVEDDIVLNQPLETEAKESFTLNERHFGLSKVNLFKIPSIDQPVMALAIPEGPAPVQIEQAPPLPFKFIGHWADPKNGSKVFLDVNGEVTAVKKGQTIQDQYRVIDIQQNEQQTAIVFLYLPLNQKQTLSIGKNK